MRASINETSRELISAVEQSPRLGDFFKTFELYRTNNIRTLSEYLSLAKGARVGIDFLCERIESCTVTYDIASRVMACYADYLSFGRVYPYDTYLTLIETGARNGRKMPSANDRKRLPEFRKALRGIRLDSMEDIGYASEAVYVMLAAHFGWEDTDCSNKE